MQQQQTPPPSHACGTLTVTVGPMFAGKSSEAKRQKRRHELAHQFCLLIKHMSDDERLSDEDAVQQTRLTDSGQHYRCSPVYLHDSNGMAHGHTAVSVAALADVPAELVAKAAYIFVDEAQWFPDLVDTVVFDWVRTQGKHVYAYGIDSDYRQRPMANMAVLMVWANHVHHRRAVCMCCGSDTASLSVKRYMHGVESEEEVRDQDNTIQPGGQDVFEARCLGCIDAAEADTQRRMYRQGHMELFHVAPGSMGVVMVQEPDAHVLGDI